MPVNPAHSAAGLYYNLGCDGYETPPPAPPAPPTPPPHPNGQSLCENDCIGYPQYAYDGYCDDSGPGAEYALCVLGTDCYDCGARHVVMPPPSPPLLPGACDCSSPVTGCTSNGEGT